MLQEEATEDFDRMAGIAPSDKPYSRTGVLEMWKRRIPWLMFLMLSATFTSMIITGFEDALSKCAVLTGFIPMLMGTGGNSGSQSSTAVILSLIHILYCGFQCVSIPPMIAAAITLNQKGVKRASILGGIMNGGMLALSGLMLLGWKPEIVEAGQTALPNLFICNTIGWDWLCLLYTSRCV